MYLLATDHDYVTKLYHFADNNAFLDWYEAASGGYESLQYIDKVKDILFIDESNLEYAHVRYYDMQDPNKHYREILAYDPSNQTYEGSIAEYLVLHNYVIESFERIGKILTA